MRRQVGIGIAIIPFGLVLFCQPFLAVRLGTRLSDIGVAVARPVSQVTQARAAYDPFASVGAPSSVAVLHDGAVEEEDGEGLGALEAGSGGPASPPTYGIAKRSKSPAKASTGAKAKALPSIRVTQAVVLRLAQAGVRPTGNPVAAAGRRPAGIQVFGVSALGIGVRDGDVLTHVSGVPVSQVGQVIAMVIAARGARKPIVVGRLWRGNSTYTIVFEQPYPRVLDPPTANQAGLPEDELLSGRASLDGI